MHEVFVSVDPGFCPDLCRGVEVQCCNPPDRCHDKHEAEQGENVQETGSNPCITVVRERNVHGAGNPPHKINYGKPEEQEREPGSEYCHSKDQDAGSHFTPDLLHEDKGSHDRFFQALPLAHVAVRNPETDGGNVTISHPGQPAGQTGCPAGLF